MTIKELKKLKRKLPRGWREELRNRLPNHSASAIHHVMHGSYNNDEIIDCAIKLAEEYKASLLAREERLKSL
jgi:hypothetical protein